MRSLIFITTLFFSCQSQGNRPEEFSSKEPDYQNLKIATFAGGCFWCVEASFEQIKGVEAAISGYAGGKAENATYKKVSYGETNHTESVQVFYDPNVIDFNTLLDIFFTAHDPTQLNRQGPDVGSQYRSAIFYHNEDQKAQAQAKIKELQAAFENTIVTELNPYIDFYKAEEYHQDYERRNPNQPYVVSVSRPKIQRVARKFAHLLKERNKK